MSSAAKTRWKILALLFVVALCSGWVGSFVGAHLRDQELAAQRRDQSSIHLLYLRRLEEALNLTPEQRDQIRPALEQASGQTRQLSARTASEAARIRADMRAAILPWLTDEQREGFSRFDTEREARHERVRGNVRSLLDSKPNTP